MINRKYLYPLILTAAMLVLIDGILGGFLFLGGRGKNDAIVSAIFACRSFENSPSCFKEAAEKLLKNYSAKEIFTEVKNNQDDASFRAVCHTFTHFVGRKIYETFGNVSESIARCDNVCFWGCQHGVLESSLKQEIAKRGGDYRNSDFLSQWVGGVCISSDGKETGQGYNECIHGVGHSLFFITDGDLKESLNLCDAIPQKENRSWCYSGVFMENSTSSTNPEHQYQYDKTAGKDPLYPCSTLTARYLSNCYLNKADSFMHAAGGDIKKAKEFCDLVPAEYRRLCYNGLGQGIAGQTQDFNVVKQKCALFSDFSYVSECIRGYVGSLNEWHPQSSTMLAGFCSVWDANSQERTVCDDAIRNLTGQSL